MTETRHWNDLRVLVVDDDERAVAALRRILAGTQLVVARSSITALAVCAEREFDVILCELLMPRLGGLGFHAALDAVRPGLADRVVFMRGGRVSGQRGEVLTLVERPCLPKPIEREQLAGVIRSVTRADPPPPSD